MKVRLSTAVAALSALLVSMSVVAVASTPANAQSGGFHTSGTQLLDANGNPFIARGTSLPHVWFTQNSPAQFNDVAALGANAVRVVLGSGHQWGPSLDVGNVVDWCKQNSMVCVLEVHDATGFGEQGGAVSILDVVRDYWGNQTVRSALQGEEAYVLINIANEPRGNNNAAAWVDETEQAVEEMRDLGYTHTLVVDAPNWGQDWQFVMRDNAPRIAAADRLDNIVFSIHMYEVFSTPQNVINYMNAFDQMGLPLIVGEFGHNHNGQNVAWQTVMSESQSRGIGWFAWSWSGNSSPAANLDQSVNFNPNNLTQWGQDVFLGTNGIQQTAQCATVFPNCGGGPGPVDPPAAPTGLTATNVTSNSVSLAWNASSGATQYQVQRALGASGGSFTQIGTTATTSFTDNNVSPDTTYRYRVVASNSAGSSQPSSSITVTTDEDGGPGGGDADCLVEYSASDWGGHPGFTASVTVTNTGSSPINGWSLVWNYSAGQTVEEPGWGATVSQSGSTVTAVNAPWNEVIQPNASVNFGFNGEAAAIGNNPAPTSFTLNGSSCDVG